MLNRPFKTVIARAAIFALVLALAIPFVSGGLTPTASAQTLAEACTTDDDGILVSCEFDYDENGTDSVADFSAMDPEGEGIDWEVEGTDSGKFDATGGVLTFKESPNYEIPGDAMQAEVTDPDANEVILVAANDPGNNEYVLTIRASEMLTAGQDPPASSSTVKIIVTVKDVDEPGSITLNRRQPQVGQSLAATLSDPDRGQVPGTLAELTIAEGGWEWSVPKVSRPIIDNDAHWQPAAGTVSTGTAVTDTYQAAEGDENNLLRVKVTYQDAEGSGKELYVLSEYAVLDTPPATPENTAPGFGTDVTRTFEVRENVAVGTVVGTVRATDIDANDILSHELTATGASVGKFKIDIATGQITVAAGLNHEDTELTNGAYPVTVTAFDPSNAPSVPAATITITATDVNEAPTVTGGATGSTEEIDSTPDNLPGEPYVYMGYTSDMYTTTDVDTNEDDVADVLEWSLSGDDGGLFDISDDGVVIFEKDPDFENPKDVNQDNAYKFNVVSTDEDGLTGMQAVTVEVTNLDEDGSVRMSTTQPTLGRAVTASVSDPDGGINTVSWQWATAGTAAGPTWTNIDGATSPTYTPRFADEDDPATTTIDESETNPGDEGMFLRATAMYRDKASGDPIEDNTDTADVDESLQGVRTVMKPSDNAVRGDPLVNNAPTFESASTMREVMESEDVNAGDPVTAKDADGDVIAYDITGGADMDKFGINSTNGQIMVGADTVLNFEGAQTSYELEVTAEDPFGGSGSTMVTLRVTDVNEMPVLENDFEEDKDNPDNYAENGAGPVATFTAMDPEGAGVTWAVEGTDESKFDITGGVLTFKESPNFEMPGDVLRPPIVDDDDDGVDESRPIELAGNNVYELTVRASEIQAEGADGNAMSAAADITVTVTDVNEPGMAEITLRQPEVDQSTVALSVTFSDPDVGQNPAEPTALVTPMFSWYVPKVSRPVTENDDHWQPATNTGNNTGQTYTPAAGDEDRFLRVKVTYTDAAGDETRSVFAKSEFPTRAQQAPNQPPAFDDSPSADYSREVAENAAPGTLVGATVTATDPNAADGSKLTYTIPTTATATGDADRFAINKATGQISVKGELDHENGSTDNDGVYAVTVTAIDPTGAMDTQEVTITAGDVNEAPTVALVPDATELTSVPENLVDNVGTTGEDESLLGTYAAGDQDVGDGVDDDGNADASEVKLRLGGDDASSFTFADGELRFKSKPNFESPTDANNDNSYKVSIVATDKAGLRGMLDVSIKVNNLDEPGEVKLSTIQPGVGQEITAAVTDPDGGVSSAMWQWQSATSDGANASFAPIDGATSMTYTPVKTVKDNPATEDVIESVAGDEGKFLRVVVTYRDAQSAPDDPGTLDVEEGRRGVDIDLDDGDDRVLTTSKNAVREIPDLNNDPVFEADITREVPENTPAEGNVGTAPVTAFDADGDVLTYTLTGGADEDAFGINPATGQIKVGAGTVLDFEGSQTTYVVEVTATDPFDGSDSAMVTITVTNVNEPPVLMLEGDEEPVTPPVTPTISVTGDATVDYEENGTGAVGTYESSEAGATWSLSGEDMDEFSISSGGVLEFTSPPDYEAETDANNDNVYMVTVTAMAAGADDGSLEVAVTVTNDTSDDETTTPDTFDPLSYDGVDKGGNENGVIDRPEVIQAIRDYFADMITQDDVTAVIRAYFAS